MKKRVAITGGIGSGKSAVLALLKEKGYSTYSCDEISKELFFEAEYIYRIEQAFPSVVKNGEIVREKLRALIFSDTEARMRLNEISHPIIMKRLLARMDNDLGDLVFAEVPLLFEGGFEKDFCETIIVKRKIKDRITAICSRDKIGEQDALKKIRAQIDYDSEENAKRFRLMNAYLLENNGDLNELKAGLEKILSSL
ncbi:MAG: dephospho-CoA kinase [Clostridia bacterium]|nr:dephospho-CoA kinase [Clostridia bacterium]